jgi:deazaflavin-dependent oxidoreductase (nitroreductase family)
VPLPPWLGRFNARVTNRVLGPLVVRLPGFAMVEHVGRRSGRRQRTPVLLFGAGDRRVIALTYGPATEWARNVIAADGCLIVDHGRPRRATEPRLVHDPTRRLVPRPIRWALAALDASDFLVLQLAA